MTTEPKPVPAFVYPPAVLLLEELAARGKTVEDLLWGLLDNDNDIAYDEIRDAVLEFAPFGGIAADAIAEYLGTSPDLWLNMERQYRTYLASQPPVTDAATDGASGTAPDAVRATSREGEA